MIKRSFLLYYIVLFSVQVAFSAAENKLYWPDGGYQQYPESRVLEPYMSSVQSFSSDEETIENHFFVINGKKANSGSPCLKKMLEIYDLVAPGMQKVFPSMFKQLDQFGDEVRTDSKTLSIEINDDIKKLYKSIEELYVLEKQASGTIESYKNKKKVLSFLYSNYEEVRRSFVYINQFYENIIVDGLPIEKECIPKEHAYVCLLCDTLDNAMFFLFYNQKCLKKIDLLDYEFDPSKFLSTKQKMNLKFISNAGKYYSYIPCDIQVFGQKLLGVDLYLVTNYKSPVKSSGFYISEEHDRESHFIIRYVEGLESETPLFFQEVKNVYLPGVESQDDYIWNIADIRTIDSKNNIKCGFLALPTGGIETKLATLQLLNLIEETVSNVVSPLSKKALIGLYESVGEAVGMILNEESDILALECFEEEIGDDTELLRKSILEKISNVKKQCTENIISEYEAEIMREQEEIKSFVIQDKVEGTKKKKGKKNKKNRKPIKKTSEKNEFLAKKEEQGVQLRGKALERFEHNLSRAGIKNRNMGKVINAFTKQNLQVMSAAKSRQKGSHCNADFGSGPSVSVPVKSHGKKKGPSRKVASNFFSTLVKTVALLDLKD
ncbi:hypothetical protein JKY79_02520 [Candidatus Babeliales bacterium]|nr:hypothetical protein [Candidatus Babeliales bacterium]